MNPGATLTIPAFLIVFVGAGVTTSLQARANAELVTHVGGAGEAALLGFGFGLVLISILTIAIGSLRDGCRRLLHAFRARELPWWVALGGLSGGFFVASQSFATPLLGVALFSVAFIASQMLGSLLVDRIGLGPLGKTPISRRRVIATGLGIAAAAIAASGRMGAAEFGAGAVVGIVAAIVAGIVGPTQQALNGRMSAASRQPLAATWVNFAVGTTGLALGVTIGAVLEGAVPALPSSGPWWMWIGGPVGLVFIATMAWAVSRYGVLIAALIAVAGQLATALVLDIVAPVGGAVVGWHLIVGIALVLTAIAVSSGVLGRRGRAGSSRQAVTGSAP